MASKKEAIKGVEFIESSDKVKGIKDDQFIAYRSDIEAIRQARGMYLGDGGDIGAFHLFIEVFNNAIDEMSNAENAHKKIKRIYVSFSEKTQTFTVGDEGRGIPIDMLVDAIMTRHFTTKSINLSESRNKKMCGQNGVGLTIVAALTDFMSVTSNRGERAKTINIINGELKEKPIQKLKEPLFGTVTSLIPSSKYLGEYHIDEDRVENFIRNMSYLVPSDFEITLVFEDRPKKNSTIIFKPKGLSNAVEYLSSTLEATPIEAKIITEPFDLSVSFSYDRSVTGTVFASYCNFVITSFGGTHEQLAQQAICQCLLQEAKRLDPTGKNEITFEDCKMGLIIAVNLEHIKPEYDSQSKTRVSNKFSAVDKKLMMESITNALVSNQGTLKKFVSYLKNVAKAREESHKIRGVKAIKQSNFLDDSEIPKFFPVRNRNTTGYTELYLCEGDSAAGGILNCRNSEYQAVLTVNGVTSNTFGKSINQVMTIPFYSNLIKVLGTGFGKDFDLTRLRYDKIIICSDKDCDGSNITSLLLCFFIGFMPELITAGKVYKAIPPLYLMDEKSIKKFASGRRTWLYDKYEYYDLVHNAIANVVELAIPDEHSKKKNDYRLLNKKETVAWLNMNAEYLQELINLGKKSACNIIVAEYISWYKHFYPKQGDFAKAVHKTFPEMSYDPKSETLLGSWNGNYFSLICDRIFIKSAQRFMTRMTRNYGMHVMYKFKNDNSKKMKEVTIGEFLQLMENTVKLVIEQRYKGVGEVEASLLFSTTVNPKFRKLYRVMMSDIDEAMEVFELLHGKSPELREKRRQLLDEAEISYIDIDN